MYPFITGLIGMTSIDNVCAKSGKTMTSGDYMCNSISFNFKRHNNTYKILKRHDYIFKNCMTFLCHKF